MIAYISLCWKKFSFVLNAKCYNISICNPSVHWIFRNPVKGSWRCCHSTIAWKLKFWKFQNHQQQMTLRSQTAVSEIYISGNQQHWARHWRKLCLLLANTQTKFKTLLERGRYKFSFHQPFPFFFVKRYCTISKKKNSYHINTRG